MIVQVESFQIRPYSNGLCWEVWERRKWKPKGGGPTKEGWQSCGVYPSTLGHALFIVFERLLKQGTHVEGLADAIDEVQELYRKIEMIGEKDAT